MVYMTPRNFILWLMTLSQEDLESFKMLNALLGKVNEDARHVAHVARELVIAMQQDREMSSSSTTGTKH